MPCAKTSALLCLQCTPYHKTVYGPEIKQKPRTHWFMLLYLAVMLALFLGIIYNTWSARLEDHTLLSDTTCNIMRTGLNANVQNS